MTVRFNLDVRGFSELMEKLAELPDEANASIVRTNNFVAQSTAQRVKQKIQASGRTGKVYTFDGRTHQASAPGEVPASLSGALANSYTWIRMTDNPNSFATAGSDLAYARVLEFGGLNDEGKWVAARPVLLPAFQEAVAQAEKVLKREFEAAS